ncbi:MAG: chromate transporter, partial [Candidatus Eremiobacteraeota bacterium]|nr:chromate transporter [Candidatus Eremiobacteraeota bacterium]
ALIGYAAMPKQPLLGASIATVAMFVPSSAIMFVADVMWERFGASPWRPIIAHGLTPAVVGLVWASVWTISHGTASGLVPYAVTAIVTVLTLCTRLSAPLLILLSGAVGIVALR